MEHSAWDAAYALAIASGLGTAAMAIYRLYFHPLAKFPGPPLAAVTHYYAAYVDLWKDGQMIPHLEELHKIYGPVVRIRPNMIHFSDPKAYYDIYGMGKKVKKWAGFYDCFYEEESSFGLIEPKQAKKRRDILNPLFSRRAILKLENVIQFSIDRLIDVLKAYAEPGAGPANLHLGLHSTTVEIITSYCHADPVKALDHPSFDHPALSTIMDTNGLFFWIQHFPFLAPFIFNLPDFLKSPAMLAAAHLSRRIAKQVDGLLTDPSSLERVEHETIYHHLLNTENGREPPTRKSLLDEGGVLIAAGSDSVGNACSVGVYNVLTNPEIHKKLVKEIREAWPEMDTPMNVQALEKLPYLTAVIKESLRFSHGVVSPLPRETLTEISVGGYSVPTGTVVCMGNTFMHRHPEIFRNPMKFDPDRWLDNKELDNNLIAFSRGPRMCPGINLGWCEMYLILGNIFRKLELENCGTTVEDYSFRAFLAPKFAGQLKVNVKVAQE
ncbi:Trichodiene oxygenase [Leucoagaricus sp. SymC.cos]|nr:Trichodiene oxygenase [Leucoagaricus sp. SymC.cos]